MTIITTDPRSADADRTRPGAPAIEYRSVTFRYGRPSAAAPGPADRPVLENITLSVRESERLGILGPNGGGKSTLLKLTLGLLDGYDGEIRVFGLSPAQARRRRLVGYVPQRIEAELDFPLTVRQVAAMPACLALKPWHSVPPDLNHRIDESLRVVGMLDRAKTPIGRLSGGQLQRVMIARALACSPRVLVLDEPTVGIDVAGQQQFAALLARLHDELRLTIVVVSHDIRTVASGCDRVACLSRTLHSHTAPEGLTPGVLAEVFRHDVAAIFGTDLHVHAHKAEACPIEGAEHAHKHGPGCGHDYGPHDDGPGAQGRGAEGGGA